jgi:hypothetical protein
MSDRDLAHYMIEARDLLGLDEFFEVIERIPGGAIVRCKHSAPGIPLCERVAKRLRDDAEELERLNKLVAAIRFALRGETEEAG